MMKRILNRTLAASLSILLTAGQTTSAWAAAAPAPSKTVILDSLQVAGDDVVIRLSGPAQYNSFFTANPPRLVVELIDTEYQAGNKVVEGSGRFVRRVRSGQFETTPKMLTRIVIDLKEIAGYRLVEEKQGLRIQLVATADTADAGSAPASPPAPEPAPAPKPTVAAKPAPKPVAKPAPAPVPAAAPTTAASAPAPVAEEAPAPVARRKVAVKKAAEPGSLSTEVAPELAAMATNKDVEKDAAPEPARPAPKASAAPRAGAARGDIMSSLPKDLVTLSFENTDIREILQLLAAKAKVNIIYGPDVTGNLTLHLSDVPFNEAFRTILSMMMLTTTQVGDNILRVLTPAELTRSRTSSTPVTKVIPLNYTKAAEMLAAVNAVRSAENRTGAVVADIKTNSLVVTEPVEGLLATERLISQLDVRPKQVLIEAKLVEVGLNNSLHYGIQWDYFQTDQARLGHQIGTNMIGTLTSPKATAGTTLPPLDNNALAAPGVGAGGRGTGVSLPASSVFGALTLGRITNNYFLSATLTAAAAQGKVKVLSDPKIATLNNQPANINVTTSIPYVTSNVASTGVQTQSVSYVVTGIKLSVTPTINADGRITLDINPDVSQPSATAAASTTGAPAVDARNAKTVVLVKDGETIVIGGLISDSVSNQVAKIPILGDIPILGWLFRKKSVVRSRSELLIFVTPKILPD